MYHVSPSWSQRFGNKINVHVIMSDMSHGNFALDQPEDLLGQRQRSLVDAPWSYLRQIHGGTVVQVKKAGTCKGEEGDALVTNSMEVPLSVQVADCAPITLISTDGILGVVHAGWKGLLEGIVDNTFHVMSEYDGKGTESNMPPSIAVVGPCIHPEVYEFGIDDLASIEKTFGSDIRSETKLGKPSLNLPEMVRLSLFRNGVKEIIFLPDCTATSPQYWSHRASKDTERQVMVAWMEKA